MKKVGIIGGIGPASTVDYYNGVIYGYRERMQDDSYPEIVMDSIDMTRMLSYVAQQDDDALVGMLLGAIQNVERAGAEFAAIASNTPHIVFDKVKERSPLPLISIVEETCKVAKAHHRKKIAVIGTKFTMRSGFYAKALAQFGIEATIPSQDEQEIIHGIIFPKLEDGIVVPEDKQKMLALVYNLLEKQKADGLVLGCTELPLMIKQEDLDTLVLNTTQIHIDSIIETLFRA